MVPYLQERCRNREVSRMARKGRTTRFQVRTKATMRSSSRQKCLCWMESPWSSAPLLVLAYSLARLVFSSTREAWTRVFWCGQLPVFSPRCVLPFLPIDSSLLKNSSLYRWNKRRLRTSLKTTIWNLNLGFSLKENWKYKMWRKK